MKKQHLATLAMLAGMTLCTLSACNSDQASDTKTPSAATSQIKIAVPKFGKDKAYRAIEKQVSFGPRVPGTAAHDSCRVWLVDQLRAQNWAVEVQESSATLPDGLEIPVRNIIATYKPEMKRRILLCAHWDTRRVADRDAERPTEPILGADDGASGVGVLLEVARVLNETPLNLGVDIVLFDAEDQGESGAPGRAYDRNTWCLGSQYWSRNPHTPNYKANYGILLDMVGSQGARFPQEGVSRDFAGLQVNKVWKVAAEAGYGNYFVAEPAQDIVDDHLFVNEIRGIPTLDIINLPANTRTGFGHYWHTHKDNMDVIDPNTLQAVGQVLLEVLYREAEGAI